MMDQERYERGERTKKYLGERNAITAQQGIRELDGRISKLNDVIIGQQTALAALTVRVNELESRLNLEKAKSFGTGPTE